MEVRSNPEVKLVFENYPENVQPKMNQLRNLVLEAAKELGTIHQLEETLKWGEPSYVNKFGSTIRMDWKAKYPNRVGIYFSCQSQLVPTFRELYTNGLQFEGNRAIYFNLAEEIPKSVVKHCFSLALNYHKLKHLPLLGE